MEVAASGLFHLEEAKAARTELVFALAIFQRQELNELVDEHGVREMVIDDPFPL